MYNYHKYLEDKSKTEKQLKQLNENIEYALRHQLQRKQLADHYRNRVQKHILEVNEHPIVVSDYHNPSQNWVLREAQPGKVLKDPQMYIRGFKKQEDRIHHHAKRNEFMDTTPIRSASLHQFRSRDLSKQIQPGMKYTSKTGVERVEDFIKNSILTQVANETFKFDKKAFQEQTHNLSLFEKRSYLSRELSKNLLPSLHQKTHFKGMQQVCHRLKATQSLQMIKRPPSMSSTQDKGNNPEFQSQAKTEMNTSRRNMKPKVDPVQLSKKALLACNVTRQKNPNIPILHRGQGKMFFQKVHQ